MKIILVHLSDMHLTARLDRRNPVLCRVEQIAAASASAAQDAVACFVVFTGDIAFSGKAEEYALANIFFEQFEACFGANLPRCAVKFVLVPGNHDCDFDTPGTVRAMVLDALKVDNCDDEVIDACCSVQVSFDTFADHWSLPTASEGEFPRLFRRERHKLSNGREILFQLVNSAWMSRKDERQGLLLFPVKLMETDEPIASSSHIVITMLHHPFNWFEAENARALSDVIEATSDVILTGHEHDEGSYRKERTPGVLVEYLEGGRLQNSDDQHDSAFNVIVLTLDQDTDSQRRFTFKWNRKDERYNRDSELPPSDLQRNRYRLRRTYQVTHSFSEFLSDPGMNFTHPGKDKLVLGDIFVYPDLREYIPDENDVMEVSLVNDPLSEFLQARRHVMLVGAEKSGKTTLMKAVFEDLRRMGVVPVFVSGTKFKRPTETDVVSVIEAAFEETYHTPDLEAFRQLPPAQKAIIIDDFEKARVTAGGRNRILQSLDGLFHLVLVVGSEELQFDALSGKTEDWSLWRYTQCQILPFGNLKRAQLVEKWCNLGEAFGVDDLEISRRRVECERLITLLLGKGLFPRFPFFILAILQQIESRRPIQLSSLDSSFGYLYDALLTTALAPAVSEEAELDTQYAYLSSFAYRLFDRGQDSMSESAMQEWHVEHCNYHRLRLSFTRMLRDLCDAGILRESNGGVAFKYPYIYYYCVGRYFRDHLQEDMDLRERVVFMSERLYRTEYANILVFLSYLSKDPIILNSILNASRGLFPDYDEYDLGSNTEFVESLVIELPEPVIDPMDDPDKQRQKLLARKDELESEQPAPEDVREDEQDSKQDSEEWTNGTKDLSTLNTAFKTIQILGQTLRNFPGSLPGTQKLEIAKECYSLGLRVMQFLYQSFEEHSGETTDAFVAFLRERDPDASEETLREEVTVFFWLILEAIAFTVVRHVSGAVGLERLARTFEDVLLEHNSISRRFIDLSIRLDHFRNFPEKETLALHRDVLSSRFSLGLLRHLVWYHFYIYKTDYRTRDSICNRIGIALTARATFGQAKKLPKG